MKARTVKLLGATYRIKDKWFEMQTFEDGRWRFDRAVPYNHRHKEIAAASCKSRIVENVELVRIVVTKEFK